MLIVLRIIFGAALFYEMTQGARSAPGAGAVGDMTGPFYMVICVVLALLNAVVWAPYLGAKLSAPLTGVLTEGTYIERSNWLLRLIAWLENRQYRRAVVACCFWEGVRHPDLPAAFVLGLRNSRAGSWFEKVYAREVFRFSNSQNCVQAFQALKRHGIDPRPHPSQEVNVALMSVDRAPRPEAQILPIPPAAQPEPPKRNPRIRLFNSADTQSTEDVS
jgi:hypothetical protein